MKKVLLTALFLFFCFLPKAKAWTTSDSVLAYMSMQSFNPVFNYALYGYPPVYYYPPIPVVSGPPYISSQNNRFPPIYLQEKINRPVRDGDDPRLEHGLPID